MNLVFIYGPPAAGKLTVATELAQITGYQLLDNHTLTDGMPRLLPDDTQLIIDNSRLSPLDAAERIIEYYRLCK